MPATVAEAIMSDIIIRSAVDADEAQLLAAIADEQDYERALHDTRKPGAEIATAYLAYLRTSVARKQGCLLVAEWSRVFAATPHAGSRMKTMSQKRPTQIASAISPIPMCPRISRARRRERPDRSCGGSTARKDAAPHEDCGARQECKRLAPRPCRVGWCRTVSKPPRPRTRVRGICCSRT